MLLALATCAELPPHEADDRPLHRALDRACGGRGIPFEQPVWTDPTVDWSRFDGVLIRTTWDYTGSAAAFCSWADRVARVSRLENPPTVIRWNTDKAYLRDLEEQGIPTVPTVWLEPGVHRLGDFAGDLAAGHPASGHPAAGHPASGHPAAGHPASGHPAAVEGFLKPRIGATAEGTLRFPLDRAGIARAEAHLQREQRTCGYLLQPFIPTVLHHGECSAIVIAGEITHGVRKVPVPGDYRVQDDFGAHDEPHVLTSAEQDLAQRAIAAAENITGQQLLYGRVDWLTDGDGTARLIELELVEPSLFFRHGEHAAERLLRAWLERLAD